MARNIVPFSGKLKHFHFTHKPAAVCAKVLIHTRTLPLVSLASLSAVPPSPCGWNASLGRKALQESILPSRESSSMGWLEDHCKAERTASTPLSFCAPHSTASWKCKKRKRCGSSFPFPPSPQHMVGCATPLLTLLPHTVEGRGTAQDVPAGHSDACG